MTATQHLFFSALRPDECVELRILGKQTRGSASFPVRPDWERPGCLIELQRVSRRDLDGHSLGKHWDLSPILKGLFT